MIHFILGGARSGKSRFGEKVVESLTLSQAKKNNTSAINPTYIATATAIDGEMSQRILKHQVERNYNQNIEWELIECPLDLVAVINTANMKNDSQAGQENEMGKVYFIDCMTLWLNNVLYRVDKLKAEQRSQISNNTSAEIEKFGNVDKYLNHCIDELIDALSDSQVHVLKQIPEKSEKELPKSILPTFVIISNEVGLGVIPMGENTRLFVDHCGWLNQKIAALADEVTLVTAGIPMNIKTPIVKYDELY